MTTLKSIGELLRSHRKRQGQTSADLAAKSGIHRNTMSALERGVGNVEINTLLSVCDQLGLELVLAPRPVAEAYAGMPRYSAISPPPAPLVVQTSGPDQKPPRETLLMRRIAARPARARENK